MALLSSYAGAITITHVLVTHGEQRHIHTETCWYVDVINSEAGDSPHLTFQYFNIAGYILGKDFSY